MKLHLYILPSVGDGNPKGAIRAAESFGTISTINTQITAGGLFLTGAHYADWWGFMYDDEVLSKGLQQALPILLNHEEQDCFHFFKKVKTPSIIDHWSYYVVPRIFRNHVSLMGPDQLVPNGINRLHNEYILDGWIEQQ
jgi:hypothetical protein